MTKKDKSEKTKKGEEKNESGKRYGTDKRFYDSDMQNFKIK